MDRMMPKACTSSHKFTVLSSNDVFYVEHGEIRLTPNDRTHLHIHWRLKTTSEMTSDEWRYSYAQRFTALNHIEPPAKYSDVVRTKAWS